MKRFTLTRAAALLALGVLAAGLVQGCAGHGQVVTAGSRGARNSRGLKPGTTEASVAPPYTLR